MTRFNLFQEFIGTLTVDQKDKVLLELLSNGKGSLDYAKNIVEFGGVTPIIPRQSHPGAHVEYVDPCQQRKKTSVVEKSGVSHHL